jgi:hypothetical protein
MRMTPKLLVAAVAAAGLLLAATAASANNGIGPLPAAPSSLAEGFGGADTSDGITPEDGFFLGFFEKGSESYNGSSTTTLVNFTLPAGTTVHFDAVECSDENGGIGGYCLGYETNCSPSGDPVVTVNGNTVEFRLACDEGEGLEWGAAVDSLLPEGTYDASVEFKVGVLRRAKDATNMWQIKLPEVFEVPGGIF